tara:strand:+ start:5314 stop:5865 length:552 start_codon:yes stop_codon:yes gene_type:complete
VDKKKQHYIDNKKFYVEMVGYRESVDVAKQEGMQVPPATEYMGKCFLDIANGLSFRPNFINYTYKDEMIADGIENCLQYCSNFDPVKSSNPFSYFTQIVYYAFVRRIEKEKKQTYIRHKLSEKMFDDNELAILQEHDDALPQSFMENLKVDGFSIDEYEKKMDVKRSNRKRPKRNLEKFMESE